MAGGRGAGAVAGHAYVCAFARQELQAIRPGVRVDRAWLLGEQIAVEAIRPRAGLSRRCRRRSRSRASQPIRRLALVRHQPALAGRPSLLCAAVTTSLSSIAWCIAGCCARSPRGRLEAHARAWQGRRICVRTPPSPDLQGVDGHDGGTAWPPPRSRGPPHDTVICDYIPASRACCARDGSRAASSDPRREPGQRR